MKSENQKTGRIPNLGIHILFWIVVLNLPLLSLRELSWTEYFRASVLSVFFVIVFYANYFYLALQYLFAKRFLTFFLANFVLILTCVISMESIRQVWMPEPPFLQPGIREGRAMPLPPPTGDSVPSGSPVPFGRASFKIRAQMVIRGFIIFSLIAGVGVSVRATSQWIKSEDIRRELEKEHLKSELIHLKNQLNPHFFFNTLNNIYGLIDSDQDKAKGAVHRLGRLMRYLLYESNEPAVPLAKEIEFLHNYIDLMKIRLAPSMPVTHQFTTETEGLKIAPLLFISLVENSFKHGISLDHPSSIEMSLNVDEHKQLTFIIRNIIAVKEEISKGGKGIGLENLRKRLQIIYPNNHDLEIHRKDNYYEVRLRILL